MLELGQSTWTNKKKHIWEKDVNKPKTYCLVATLDIRNAFSSAQWDCILEACMLAKPQSSRYFETGLHFEELTLVYFAMVMVTRKHLEEMTNGNHEYFERWMRSVSLSLAQDGSIPSN